MQAKQGNIWQGFFHRWCISKAMAAMLESTPQFHQFIFFNSNAILKVSYKAKCKVYPQDVSDYWTSEPVNSHKSSRDQCLVYALFGSAGSMQLFLREEATIISGAPIDFFFFAHSIVLCPLCADARQYVLCLGNQLAKKTPNNQPNISHRAQSILRFFAAQMCEWFPSVPMWEKDVELLALGSLL